MKLSLLYFGFNLVFFYLLESLVFSEILSPKVFPGYQLVSPLKNTSFGLSGQLRVISPPHLYDTDISPLQVDIYFETRYRLRVKLYDPNNARWEVPWVVQESNKNKLLKDPLVDSLYNFSYIQNPFGFAISRKSNNQVLFNTSGSTFNGLIFEDPYLEISAQRPGKGSTYGLGERTHSVKLDLNVTYTIYNHDNGGVPENKNLYGSHPFYLEILPTGEAYGVFLLNSNAMDVILSLDNSITYKVIGGILDFYFFLGPTPEQVIQQYHELIGFTHFPPYWALGFHQCRWGYFSIDRTKEIVDNYRMYNIPLETMWNDIDYMSEFRDFTFSSWFAPEKVKAFVSELHKNGQHYVIIVDPGLVYENGYMPTQRLLEINGYVKDKYGDPMVNIVWPGFVIFPDFSHPNTSTFWIQMLEAFYFSTEGLNGAPFDGLWIDMNEISGMCNGECNIPFEKKKKSGIPNSMQFDPDHPPYIPGGFDLNSGTMSLSGYQYASRTYNLHNLYSFLETKFTNQALEKIRGERSLLVSRSSYAGSGKYGGHWLGDNASTFKDLYFSIPGILAFNMFGIGLVGADICGFTGETTKELCTRWIELGSFYPFCRNHNSIFMRSQELYEFGEDVVNISRNVLLNRAHTEGGTIVRPLVFEYPSDTQCHSIDRQFLVGSGLLVTPVLDEGVTSVSAYFPKDTWYDYYSGAPVSQVGHVTLNIPIDEIKAHVRGGLIIPTQQPAYTLRDTRLLPFTLLIALDKQGSAKGELYWDNGVELSVIENNHFTLISYLVTTNNGVTKLSSSISNLGYDMNSLQMGGIKVFGVATKPSKILVNGVLFSNFTYDTKNQVLQITQLQLSMSKECTISWS